MTVYPTYKDSGIEWLGQIPTHWDLLRNKIFITEHDNVVGQDAYKYTLLSLTKQGVIQRDIESGKGKFPKEFDNYKIVESGNIIFCLFDVDETPRTVGLSSIDGMITGAYNVFSIKGINSQFYYYYFLAVDEAKALRPLYSGLRKVVKTERFAGLRIPVPPEEEQRQIVAYLDYKSNKINERICQREIELQTLSELKQAEIAAVVTRGLDPNVPMKESGIEWIGQIPAHWEIKYLSQIAEEHYISNKDVHHQNLLSLSYGRIVRKDINTTEGLLPASFDTYQVIEKGNIILRLTDLQNDHKSLRIGLVTEEGIITSAYICIQSRRAVLPEYLYLLLHSYDICKVFYGMGGGLRQSLSYADIKRVPIIIPAISEQVEIIKHINAKTKNFDIYMESLKKEIELLQEYKQRLISDVVTGKVDVRGVEIPNEE